MITPLLTCHIIQCYSQWSTPTLYIMSQCTQIVSTVVDTITTSHMRYVSYSQCTQIVSTVVDTITTSHMRYVSYSQYSQIVSTVVNPRRACARVTVLVLSVCLCVCVCVFPILAPRAIRRTNSSISDFSAIRA